MPRGCVMHMPQYAYAIGVSCTNGNIVRMRIVIDTGVGFCVARFDRVGIFSGASERGASDSQGFTFFYVYNLTHLQTMGY